MTSSIPSLLPIEWVVFGAWMLLGLSMYLWSRKRYGVAYSDRMMARELSGDSAVKDID
ncbi:hypothetical protein [Chromohalobacter japonicus]|uniref:hypothetical protein n=1 Tax=Chromohalobacter japonicus TaxID=223900 RepID=UPI003F8DD045